MAREMSALVKKEIRWTPRLIRQLRGKRTLAAFGAVLGAPKNTVWRWEAGKARPDFIYSGRLSGIAERERFLEDWKLAGSIRLLGELDGAEPEIAGLFRKSIERTSRELTR